MVTKEDIEQLASTARLQLSEEELQSFSEQLNRFVEYASEQLDQVDLSAANSIDRDTEYKKRPYREDVVVPSLPREQLLANAPDEEDGYFKVPSVLD